MALAEPIDVQVPVVGSAHSAETTPRLGARTLDGNASETDLASAWPVVCVMSVLTATWLSPLSLVTETAKPGARVASPRRWPGP
jgi:hypothetical protein